MLLALPCGPLPAPKPEAEPKAPVAAKAQEPIPPASADFNFRLMRQIFRVQSKSKQDHRMRQFLWAMVPKLAGDAPTRIVEEKGNLYVTKGRADLYPCVVAHLDTVHEIVPKGEYELHSNDAFAFAWNPVKHKRQGVGGDDKCGIFLALELLRTLPAVKLAFFRDEEIGCQGAHEANMAFFADCAFALQGDRRGHKDFVKRASGELLYGKAFETEVAPYLALRGFEPCTFGASTDVATLKRNEIGICVVNCSAGYYLPHTSEEYVILADLERTLNLFRDLCENLSHRRWTHEREKTYAYEGYGYGEGLYGYGHYGGAAGRWTQTGYGHYGSGPYGHRRAGRAARWRPATDPTEPISPGHWERERPKGGAATTAASRRSVIAPDRCGVCHRRLDDPCDECAAFDLLGGADAGETDDELETMALIAAEKATLIEARQDICPKCGTNAQTVFDPEEGAFFCFICNDYVGGD